MILAGDVGGTKCRLALYDLSSSRPCVIHEKTLASDEFDSLEAVAERFLEDPEVAEHLQDVAGACFGIAGPVVRGQVKAPNLPWEISTEALQQSLELDSVSLINDLEATGYGVLTLPEDQLHPLNQAEGDSEGHMALIAAGTGLGEAILIRGEGGGVLPVPSEGGHTEFGPRNPLEMELLEFLMREWSHVSYERVVSGPGLYNVYRFFREKRPEAEKEVLRERMEEEEADPAAIIGNAGLNEECELCVRALDLFTSVYGAEAGNLALTVKAVGGVYIGGGIAPKLLKKLTDGTFLDAFNDKGRLRSLMEKIPLRVILNPRAALIGAAHYGARRFES